MANPFTSRKWQRISNQIQSFSKKCPHWCRSSQERCVKFCSINSVYYTHSSTEYDRSPSQKSFEMKTNGGLSLYE
ncbi:hypothetical protein BY458DRAFT_501745 [Sporodiniella umbellata]|nr:hypothetical protein BY458DRAFT_501745 [Sporodiniella umbellata]